MEKVRYVPGKILGKKASKRIIVDEDVYPLVYQYKWYLDYGGYAISGIWFSKEISFKVRFHHLVVGYPLRSMMVDHINGDKLDNRRSNLRIVTRSHNNRNARPRSKNGPGIYWLERRKMYGVTIKKDKKTYNFGAYKTLEDARIMRDQKYQELYSGSDPKFQKMNYSINNP